MGKTSIFACPRGVKFTLRFQDANPAYPKAIGIRLAPLKFFSFIGFVID